MINAYTILGFDSLSLETLSDELVINDKTIKQAYLQKVRQYPPQQHAQEFSEIRQAYEFLKTEKSRISYNLFHIEQSSATQILSSLFIGKQRFVPSQKQFLNALKESL